MKANKKINNVKKLKPNIKLNKISQREIKEEEEKSNQR